MTEQFLHRADVTACFPQTGGESVPTIVAGGPLGDPRAADRLDYRPADGGFMGMMPSPNGPARQRPAPSELRTPVTYLSPPSAAADGLASGIVWLDPLAKYVV